MACNPERPEVLRLGERVLDLDLPHNHGKGYDYELLCLGMLSKEFPDLFVLGPRFVEMLLLRYGYKGCQPDVIMFKPKSKKLELNGFMEIKSGHISHGDAENKINAITRLVGQLKGYDKVIMAILVGLIGDTPLPFNMPNRIEVPQDVGKINVYFISPDILKLGVAAKRCPFRVSQKHYRST